MARATLRIRDAMRPAGRLLSLVPTAAFYVALGVAAVFLLFVTRHGAQWDDIIRQQALNLLWAGALAGLAYLAFYLRYRHGELRLYRARCVPPIPEAPAAKDDWNALVTTIADELLDARPPQACLIAGPAEARRPYVFARLVARLLEGNRVPVLVDLDATADGRALAVETRARFVGALVGSTGDAANAERLFRNLVRRRRVVALVSGLNRVVQAKPITARRQALTKLLEGALDDGLLFVGWVPPELAPSISEVATFRTRPLRGVDLAEYTTGELERRNVAVGEIDKGGLGGVRTALEHALQAVEPTRDPALLDLAVRLLQRRVQHHEPPAAVATDLFNDPCAFRRHARWMTSWAFDCSLETVGDLDSPAAFALAALGLEGHYRGSSMVALSDVRAGLGPEEGRRLAAGTATLAQRGVVALSPGSDGDVAQFSDPFWFWFAGAIGLRLDERRWCDLLDADVPSATLDALTAALFLVGAGVRRQRSFIDVLRRVGLPERQPVTLGMAIAVVTALQADDGDIVMGEREVSEIGAAWSTAGDVLRLRFVADMDLRRQPRLIDFLWEQLVPPAFATNSFRVRRAISIRLAGLGDVTWDRLGRRWSTLIHQARAGDLSSKGRRKGRPGFAHWNTYGPAVASLGWVLPGVVMRMTSSAPSTSTNEAFAMLELLRSTVQIDDRAAVRAHRSVPEIGLEISLAEGFKIAAAESALERSTCGSRWYAAAEEVLAESTSWISRQGLLQALAFVRLPDPERERARDRLGQQLAKLDWATHEHPFLRETAVLVRRVVDHDRVRERPPPLETRRPLHLGWLRRRRPSQADEERRLVERMTGSPLWYEDTEALEDGGVGLSEDAHRLLGVSTLLINLVESHFTAWRGGAPGEAIVERREQVFTEAASLPKCFRSGNHAATMFDAKCDCGMELCGPCAIEPLLRQARSLSRSFAQRAQVTAHAGGGGDRLGHHYFPRRAFARTWRALDQVMEHHTRERATSGDTPGTP